MEQSHILQKKKSFHVSFVFIGLIKNPLQYFISRFDDINVKHKNHAKFNVFYKWKLILYNLFSTKNAYQNKTITLILSL